jgi:hypothetical protein
MDDSYIALSPSSEKRTVTDPSHLSGNQLWALLREMSVAELLGSGKPLETCVRLK